MDVKPAVRLGPDGLAVKKLKFFRNRFPEPGKTIPSGPTFQGQPEVETETQFTRLTSTRLSENDGDLPKPPHSWLEIEFTDPSERFNERQ